MTICLEISEFLAETKLKNTRLIPENSLKSTACRSHFVLQFIFCVKLKTMSLLCYLARQKTGHLPHQPIDKQIEQLIRGGIHCGLLL